MTDDQHQWVDIDLVGDDRSEAFDGWRIKNFLDDEGSAAKISAEELTQACAHLASIGELREVQARRWYALR
jgi:hypothetical protein